MVISKTSAVEANIHAVLPESILGSASATAAASGSLLVVVVVTVVVVVVVIRLSASAGSGATASISAVVAISAAVAAGGIARSSACTGAITSKDAPIIKAQNIFFTAFSAQNFKKGNRISDGVVAGFASTYTYGLLHGGDEYFSVTNFSCSG